MDISGGYNWYNWPQISEIQISWVGRSTRNKLDTGSVSNLYRVFLVEFDYNEGNWFEGHWPMDGNGVFELHGWEMGYWPVWLEWEKVVWSWWLEMGFLLRYKTAKPRFLVKLWRIYPSKTFAATCSLKSKISWQADFTLYWRLKIFAIWQPILNLDSKRSCG